MDITVSALKKHARLSGYYEELTYKTGEFIVDAFSRQPLAELGLLAQKFSGHLGYAVLCVDHVVPLHGRKDGVFELPL